MELGEKLRQARLEAGLSQRQLCGQEITRNMLSQIESGKARPSMATLQYLAARLGKSVSYFLDESAGRSPDQAALDTARTAFCARAWQSALEALAQYRGTDRCLEPEKALLEFLCLVELGREALDAKKLPYARQLLEKAGNTDSPYLTPALEQERQLLLAMAGGEATPAIDPRPLLLRAEQALAAQDPAAAIHFLEAVEDRDARWDLLRGHCAVLEGDPKAALEFLHNAEPAFPRETAPLLEDCYRELEDYKMAYRYACLARQQR